MENLRAKIRKKCFGQLGKLIVQSARQAPVIAAGTKIIESAEQTLKFYIPPAIALATMLMVATILETCLEEWMDRAYEKTISLAKQSIRVAPVALALLTVMQATPSATNTNAAHPSSYARQLRSHSNSGEGADGDKRKIIFVVKRPPGPAL